MQRAEGTDAVGAQGTGHGVRTDGTLDELGLGHDPRVGSATASLVGTALCYGKILDKRRGP